MHVSQLADRYIKDPNDAVKVGQKVKVTVQAIDLARGRIALSMRSDGGSGVGKPQGGGERGEGGTRRDVTANNRGPARPAPGNSPAAKLFVPTKGAVAPNGIRFK